MKRKREATAPVNETPEGKLKRLASLKVGKAIHHIMLCSNLAYYHPTKEQASAIADALTQAVSEVSARLISGKSAARATFKL